MYRLPDQFFNRPLLLTTSILSNSLHPCTLYQINSFASLYSLPIQFYQILYLHVHFTDQFFYLPLLLTTSILSNPLRHVPFTRSILLPLFTLDHFNSIKSFTSKYPLPDEFFYLHITFTTSILSKSLPPCTLYQINYLTLFTPYQFNFIKSFTCMYPLPD